MEGLAAIHKHMAFMGIDLVEVHGGEADTITVGLRGLYSQLYSEDTARKVHHGLSGVVSRGKRAGGSVYGYRPNPAERGNPAIVPEEAEIIERIFREYSLGLSPRSICARLNVAHVKPPSGSLWAASALYGCAGRAPTNRAARACIARRAPTAGRAGPPCSTWMTWRNCSSTA